MEENIIVDIIRIIGAEKASQLFLGEPIHDADAWILLDHLRKRYHYETLYEDEEGECYILVMRVADKYIYILLKDQDGSRGYLVEALTPRDYETAIRLAKEEYGKCTSK
jgi:hypothetical protein